MADAHVLPADLARVGDLFSLRGKTALVTGAASGLGRAIAIGLAAHGADVAAADLNLAGAEATAAVVRDFGRRATVVGVDVTDWEQVRAMVASAVGDFGRIDIAFNVPGINCRKPALEMTPEEFRQVIDVNLIGVFHCAKAIGEVMVKQGQGRMVNIASMMGHIGGLNSAPYTASKHAVVGLIRELAHELAPAVRVNGVAPGPIGTDLRGPQALGMAERSIGSLDLSTFGANVPLGKVPAAADYAGAFVFLASRRDARPATGGVINLDSGIGVRGVGRVAGGAKLAGKYATDPT